MRRPPSTPRGQMGLALILSVHVCIAQNLEDVPGFAPELVGGGKLYGASGVAFYGGRVYTVLESDGVNGTTLASAAIDVPSSWRPVEVKFPHQRGCDRVTGGHPQVNPEFESIDISNDGRFALGSDRAYVAVGSLRGEVAVVDRCLIGRDPPLGTNKGFEAVALKETHALAVAERPLDRDERQVYFSTFVEGTKERLRIDGSIAVARPDCAGGERITGAATLGSTALLLMNCRGRGSFRSYRFFIVAVPAQGGSPVSAELTNVAHSEDFKAPNLEGIAAAGCDRIWVVSDNRYGGKNQGPTVLRKLTLTDDALRAAAGC